MRSNRIFVPPIKCQGIKTKLVPLIKDISILNDKGKWIEPFMGSGVVGFNIRPRKALSMFLVVIKSLKNSFKLCVNMVLDH